MNKIMLKLILGTIVAVGMPQGLHAQDQTVSGDLTVTGTVDINGNILSMGTLTGTATYPGWQLGYADGTTSSLNFQATRAGNIWKWWENGIGTPQLQMTLDNNDTLTLFNASGTADITLNPTGTSTFVNSLTVNGTDNEMPNQSLVNSNSILTEGLADSRYLHTNTSGYVGVGTSAPSEAFSVLLPSGSQGTITGFGANGVQNLFTIGYYSGVTSLTGSVYGPTVLQTQNNQNLALLPNGSGEVGIGTTSPNATLCVIGTLSVQGAGAYPYVTPNDAVVNIGWGDGQNIGLHTSTESNYGVGVVAEVGHGAPGIVDENFVAYRAVDGGVPPTVGTGAGLLFQIDGGSTDSHSAENSGHIYSVITNTNNGTHNNTALVFQDENNGSLFEAMRIDSTGNVGIGTVTPVATLEVNGSTKVDGTMTANRIIVTSASGDIPMFGH